MNKGGIGAENTLETILERILACKCIKEKQPYKPVRKSLLL